MRGSSSNHRVRVSLPLGIGHWRMNISCPTALCSGWMMAIQAHRFLPQLSNGFVAITHDTDDGDSNCDCDCGTGVNLDHRRLHTTRQQWSVRLLSQLLFYPRVQRKQTLIWTRVTPAANHIFFQRECVARAIQFQPCSSSDHDCLCAHSQDVQDRAVPCAQQICSAVDVQC
jgi:hypothetical protein